MSASGSRERLLPVEQVLETFKSHDAAKSWEAFAAVRKACMACHEAVSLSETHTRIYWWCSLPKTGMANV
jgi:hypothetical protein